MTNPGWGNASNWARRRRAPALGGAAPGSKAYTQSYGAGTQMPNLGNNFDWDPLPGSQDPNFWNPGEWGGIGAGPGGGNAAPGVGGGGRGSININQPVDYRGILDRYTADWRARLNTGLANMNANRLSNARSLINRMGVRDPNAALAKLAKFGITAADLKQAADNPWSELKAITQRADRARGQGEAEFAGRGLFRSGGTAGMYEDVENERARTEAQAEQDMLQGLATGEQQVAQWQQEQEDQLAQRTSDLDMQLSQQYQPQTASWDDSQGGYRWGNVVYDQYGNIIRRL